MADLAFHHGSRVFDNAGAWIDVELANSACIFLSGTAPDADANAFPLNRPVLIKGAADYNKLAKLGSAGTLKRELDAIMDQGGTSRLGAYIYVHRFAPGNTPEATLTNLVGDRADMTGVFSSLRIPSISGYGRELFKPRIFIAPGFTASLATDGVKTVSIETQGGGYSDDTTLTVSGGGGRGAVLLPIIEGGAITGVTVKKPGWGYTSAPTVTAVDPASTPGSGADFEAVLGTVGNPVAHEYEGLAAQFRAVAFIDGPGTTDEAAVLSRECYGSDRLYFVDPPLTAWNSLTDAYSPGPASGRFAGVQCRVDRDQGLVKSVSNEPINGIDGPVRPIHYGNQTNYLNQNRVATVVNYGEGWRTWGNRTTSGMFLAVRRTRDLVNEALEMAYLRGVDRPMLDLQIKILEEVGRDFLTTLERRNYIMQGSSALQISRTKNTKGQMRAGRIIFDLKYETPPPMEDIVVEADDNIQAYELLLNRLAGSYDSTLVESTSSYV